MREFTSAILIGLCFISVKALGNEQAAPPPRVVKVWGHKGTANGEFEFPTDIAIHKQTIFATVHYTNRVQTFDFDGKFTGFKDKVAKVEGPIGIAVDPHDPILVASINGRIQQFDINGKLLGGVQSSQGSESGKFFAPHTLAFNSRGEFFIVDSFNHRIQKFAVR